MVVLPSLGRVLGSTDDRYPYPLRPRDGATTARPRMSWGGLDRGTLLRRLGNVVLVLGVVAGLAIYIAASRRTAADYELPETKAYLRQMEVYGGQANVLATDLRDGFAALWHGKPLGVTVAVLGLLLRAGLYFFADPLLPEDDEPPAPPGTS